MISLSTYKTKSVLKLI